MVKFGRLTNPSEDIEKEIKKTKRLGFDYVEIGIEAPAILFYKKNEFAILKSLKEFKHSAIGHTTWWYELGSPFPSVRKGWIEQAKADIRIANAFGIKLLNFHFLVLSKFLLQNKRSRQIILENYVDSLNELSKFAKKVNMILMLENGDENFKYYKYVLDRALHIKVHFDIGHAFLSGGMKTIKKFVSYFQDGVEHVHAHDNHGKQDEHLALRNGKINWKEVISILKKYNYDKTITFEVFESDKDLLKSREYFRKLWD